MAVMLVVETVLVIEVVEVEVVMVVMVVVVEVPNGAVPIKAISGLLELLAREMVVPFRLPLPLLCWR